MLTANGVIIATFLVYILIVLVLGYIAWRRTANLSDYILGGRSLGPWVGAMSAQASDMSGWLLLGLPGFAYAAGFQAVWMVLGLLIGTYLNWRFIASPLRRVTHELDDSLTLPDYFERRFKDTSRLLRSLSAFFILVFFAIYTSSGFVAAAELFESLFGTPYLWALFWGAMSVLVYTFFGGFLAVSWSDMLQGSLMFIALVIVAGMGLYLIGGPSGLHATMNAINPQLYDPWTDISGKPLGLIAILSLVGWGLGYPGQPHILARFMALRSPDDVKPARTIAMVWVVVCLGAAVLIGYTGLGVVHHVLTGKDTEKVFIYMSTELLNPVVAGVCLSGILAAIMSTASSQLLVSSSAFAQDFYKSLFRPNPSTRELLWVGRLAVLTIAVIAYLLAINPNSKVLNLVAHAWAGFGAAFGPAIVLSLFWKGMTRAGAFAGIVVGGLTVIIWPLFADQGGLFALYEMVPGVLFAASAIWGVSHLTHSGASPAV